MEIKLTGKLGGTAIVSPKDYKLISKYSWSQIETGYASATVEGIKITMHQFVFRQYNTNIPKDKMVDHINRHRLDNQRENLRLVPCQINCENKTINKNKNSSNYRGVYSRKENNKFEACLIINGKRIYLGKYDKEIDAAVAVDMYLVHDKKDCINLNFPEKKDEYLKREYKPYVKKEKWSDYIGVVKVRNKFGAKLVVKGKSIFVMTDKNELACAKAYDKYVADNNIPGRKINFPEDYPNYNPNSVIKTEYKKTNKENIIRLVIKSQPNKIVLIDKEDYDKIKYYAWNFSDNGYLSVKINGKSTRLTHFLLNVNDPKIFVDHIDSNILNNCKSNLRISNSRKNPQNKSKSKNTISKYYGVSFIKQTNKWFSYIQNNYKNKTIGRYSEEIYAARSRDLYILIHLPGTHYKLNFEWNNKDINKWKKLLYSPLSPNRWVAKKEDQKAMGEAARINDALDKNKMLLFEKLNESRYDTIKENISIQCKKLGI